MTARVPTGVLVAITDNDGPMTHEEFDRWYDEVHVPDVLQTGCYYAATRYESTGEGEGRYLAVYETDWPDPIAAFEELPSPGRPHATLRRPCHAPRGGLRCRRPRTQRAAAPAQGGAAAT